MKDSAVTKRFLVPPFFYFSFFLIPKEASAGASVEASPFFSTKERVFLSCDR